MGQLFDFKTIQARQASSQQPTTFSHFITLKFCLIKSRLLWIVSCPLLGYQQWCCCVRFSFNFVFVVFQSKRISVRICQPFLNLKDLVTISYFMMTPMPFAFLNWWHRNVNTKIFLENHERYWPKLYQVQLPFKNFMP